VTSLFPTDSVEVLPFDGSAKLIPHFFETRAANEHLESLASEVRWEQHHLVLFGKKVPEPRQSAWIADDGISYSYSGIAREAHAWTPTLTVIRSALIDEIQHPFNSVLANLYRDGSDAMGWHSDDEPCNGPEPVIASVSFGAERRFDFRHQQSGEKVSVLLPHGSLLVMSGLSQHCWQHSIARSKKITAQRINLTFRSVATETSPSSRLTST
jgi:alkylated DNA repair dioxygenase AlkB